MCDELAEIDLLAAATVMPSTMAAFVDEGIRRSKEINCFDFVPSNSNVLHATLSALPRGRFCEWGSGMGIGVGIAEMLGFRAVGFEISDELANAARQLLRDFGLKSDILTGNYFEIRCEAEYYFVYEWPSRMRNVRSFFADIGRLDAKLLICDGAERIRCEVLPLKTDVVVKE